MKVIFLDIDGCLNSCTTWMIAQKYIEKKKRPIDQQFENMIKSVERANVEAFKMILDEIPDLKIVVHSNWRKTCGEKLFVKFFEYLGIDSKKYLGNCSWKMSSDKSHDIHSWIEDWKEANKGKKLQYVVIDDGLIRDDEFIPIDGFSGLTLKDAEKIIQKFKPKFRLGVIV